MLHAAVAQVEDPDTAAAVEKLVAEARARWPRGALPPSVGVVFAGIHVDHAALLLGLRGAWPGLRVVGCTTDGEAASPDGFAEDSIALTLLGSEDVGLGVGVGRGLGTDAARAAEDAVREASRAAGAPARPLRAVVALADSLTASGAALVDALQDAAGADVPVLGGTAGDQLQFRGTYQLFDDEVLQDAVVALAFSGPVTLAHGVASGWRPVGPSVEVTGAAGNVVQALGGRPALRFYQDYIGPRDPLGEHALAVYEAEDEISYMRAPLATDPETGAITFTGDVPVGARVRLTEFTRAAVLEGCETSIERARRRFQDAVGPDGAPALAWFFSCAGRKEALGTWSAREFGLVREHLGAEVPVAGFYAYGEIAPLAPGEPSRFHAETFVTLLLGSHR